MKAIITIFLTLLALAIANMHPSLERLLRQSNQLSTRPEEISTTSEPMKSYIQCRADYNKRVCKYGYQQIITKTYINCGQNEDAMTLAGQCDTNINGIYCLEPYLTDLELGQGISLQFQSLANRLCLSVVENAEESCTDGCRNALTAMKSHYGCCINSMLNSTSNTSQIYSYDLWLKCSVATPESCGASMSINLIHDTPVCTEDELLYRELRDLRCTSENRFLLDKMSSESEGCGEFISLNKRWCLTNTQGAFCTEISELTAKLVREVYNNCSSTQTECPTDCKTALETLKDELGCCIDSTYDSEYFLSFGDRINLTDDALWKQCEVGPPPRACANMLDGALRSQANSVATLVVAMLLLAVQRILT